MAILSSENKSANSRYTAKKATIVKASALKSNLTKSMRLVSNPQMNKSGNKNKYTSKSKVRFAPTARVVLVRKISKEDGRKVWYHSDEYRTFDRERRHEVAIIQNAIIRNTGFDGHKYTVLGLEKYLHKPSKLSHLSTSNQMRYQENDNRSVLQSICNRRKEKVLKHTHTILAKQHFQKLQEQKEYELEQQQPLEQYTQSYQPLEHNSPAYHPQPHPSTLQQPCLQQENHIQSMPQNAIHHSNQYHPLQQPTPYYYYNNGYTYYYDPYQSSDCYHSYLSGFTNSQAYYNHTGYPHNFFNATIGNNAHIPMTPAA